MSFTANVLFIGAHPNDIELGCGGTLIKHIVNKDIVYTIVLSDGEMRIGKSDADRIQEAKNALLDAGIDEQNITFIHVPDTMFMDYRKIILNEIEKVCSEHKIKKVYTHTNKEFRQDHVVVFEETLRGARNVSDILTYELCASTLPTFSPNYYVNITEVFHVKLLLLGKHGSQSKKAYFDYDFISSLAKFRGSQIKKLYAEGFEIVRMIGE